VVRNEELLKGNATSVRAVAVNAGNANAGNGQRGRDDNVEMARLAAEALGLSSPDHVLTASTGVIGTPMPMDRLRNGIQAAGQSRGTSPEHAADAARAIITTDLVTKEHAVRFVCASSGRVAHVGGMAKGSGMIAPNMATMLAFVTTDGAIAPQLLDQALRQGRSRLVQLFDRGRRHQHQRHVPGDGLGRGRQ
jgi:glutamate N-acetyltransferase/amino-acid N-acetyltransferase